MLTASHSVGRLDGFPVSTLSDAVKAEDICFIALEIAVQEGEEDIDLTVPFWHDSV
jgi:hypothetical protein